MFSSIGRGLYWLFLKPFVRLYRVFNTLLTNPVAYIPALWTGIVEFYSSFQRILSGEYSGESEASKQRKKHDLLDEWGIDDNERDRVYRNLLLESAGFFLLFVVGGFNVIWSFQSESFWSYFISGFIIGSVGLIVGIRTYYYLDLIYRETYVPFGQWLGWSDRRD